MILGAIQALWGQKPVNSSLNFSYPETVLPQDTTKLWLQEGDESSDTVLILCQGGPDKFLGVEIDGKSVWRYLPAYKAYQIAHLHQAQTLNPAMFDFMGAYTLEMAQHETRLSEEILLQTISYFQQRKKYIVVLGHSYGAFIVIRHLANSPIMADRYLISGGRLNAPTEMVEDHLKGLNGELKEDGKTYLPFSAPAYEGRFITPRMQKIYRVKQLLKAAIGQPRYTEQITHEDLSHISFIYAENDQNVGSLTEEEQNWLKARKAQLIATQDGHYHLYRRIVDAVEKGEIKF